MSDRISQSNLVKYAKQKLGVSHKDKTSLYVLACDALAIDGLVKPDDVSYRKWVEKNLSIIGAALGKVVDKKQKQKINKKLLNGNRKSPDKIVSKDFLMTYEWRKLRMEALKLHGAKCQCCGASPSTGAVLNVDHIKPRKLFPHLALDIENLQVLCAECNHGKGNWDQTDWRKTIV
jgi:5-methylcytosine-specific restriction endonuclease McrA